MKYLVIIATRDFWYNQTDFIDNNRTIYILPQGEGRTDEKPLTDFTKIITDKIDVNTDFELGVIFHKLNGEADANTFRESLRTSFNDKLAFCDWYSSNKTDFWNETDANADLPYNNIKKACKDNNGDKKETFNAVWDYFSIDQSIEKPLKKLATSLPFDYIHENNADLRSAKNELQKAIDLKLKK